VPIPDLSRTSREVEKCQRQKRGLLANIRGVAERRLCERIWNGSTEPYSPDLQSGFSVPACGWACSMTKSRRQELSEKAAAERRRCSDWLIPFMQNGQPKFLTKDELRVAAMHQLNVSKSSFDFAWIDAIEKTDRQIGTNPCADGGTPKPSRFPVRVIPTASGNALWVSAGAEQCAYWEQSGKHVLDLRFPAFDPTRTLG
jgi:hypothetical protein